MAVGLNPPSSVTVRLAITAESAGARRVYARPLLDALGWSVGHRVDIAVVAGVLVVGSKPGGLHVVGSRGVLTSPAAARNMCGIEAGVPVVLLASPPQNVLVAHPAGTIARLLAQPHARLEGDA